MQADEIVVQRIGEGDLAFGGHGMVRAHHHHQLVAPVKPADQFPRVAVAGADAQIGGPVDNALHDAAAGPFLEVDLHPLVFGGEAGQVLRQELDDGREIGQHAHIATHAFQMLAQFQADLLHVGEHAPGMVQQGFASRRQVHAPGLPGEERKAQRAFQIHQPLARRRYGDGLALRRARQRAFLMHGDEQLQRDQIETAKQVVDLHGLGPGSWRKGACSVSGTGYPGGTAPRRWQVAPAVRSRPETASVSCEAGWRGENLETGGARRNKRPGCAWPPSARLSAPGW
ncbi:hypothetical protein D9M69_206340 [compost metagenome]